MFRITLKIHCLDNYYVCVCICTYMDSRLPLKGRKDQTLVSVLEMTQPFILVKE